ncbi:MAG: GGDEF domain-containing protein [Gammaproteobacteria bacterium]|jgi:diguanylate cyclase (GGDEF)-like protein
MKKDHFNFVLIATLLSVVFLSALWEFWLEDIIGPFFGHDHRSESIWVRVEYVISITVFVTISLIIPVMIGYRLIDNHEKLTEKIKRLAEEDYLTRLYNRRKIHEVVENEILRSRRYNSTFAIIILDIDNFKKANDTFGHNIGDKLLVEIANIIRQTIRESDIASRWGGEEFLVFCPQTGSDGAFALAEKLRTNIEKHEFEKVGYKTASFGVAQIEHGDSFEEMISRADKALYAAKNSGKNIVLTSA